MTPTQVAPWLVTVLGLASLSACAGQVADGPAPTDVAVEIEPPAVTLPPAGQAAFTATVTGSVVTSVTWTIDGAGCGTITQGGLYTAPDVLGTCSVRVTSDADETRTATATVTIVAGPPVDPLDPAFQVRLVAQAGVSGVQRVNFAVPLPPGLLSDPARLRVTPAGRSGEIATSRRILAQWPDHSIRSVQVQADVDVASTPALDVEVGAASAAGTLTRVEVAETLVLPDGTAGPRVWATLPAEWLAASQVAGPVLPQTTVAGTELDAWSALCDYSAWGIDAFLPLAGDRASWLYDRPAALYRGYAITGALDPLASAYREAAMYRAGITGTGSATRISVPTAESDLKYHYSEGMAIHYLLTGDDRFREAAENVAIRAHDLWTSPGYAGGADFWTERHAGFALLAYEWASAVTEGMAATFAAWADEAVTAYLALQETDAYAWEEDARCFAHHADAHGEPYGYVGCSPWMSAILADGIDAYARRVGGDRAAAARDGLVRLGRMIARHGRDTEGRPYYWMGAGLDSSEIDPYEEHWGESAYVVGLAWHWDGRRDPALRSAAKELVNGLGALGEVGHLRSFNWQCRSAVMAPYYLRE